MSLTQCPNLDDLKMVKEAQLKVDREIVTIDHYNTTIFKTNLNTKQTEINLNCSSTSNKMIYRALTVFGLELEKCVNIHKGKKMNYSGANE